MLADIGHRWQGPHRLGGGGFLTAQEQRWFSAQPPQTSAWYALGESGAMLTDVQTNHEHDGSYGRLLL